jgi:hypothetical protein
MRSSATGRRRRRSRLAREAPNRALLGKLGKIDEARRWFADLPAVTIEQRVQVRQGEAQLLRDAGDIAGALCGGYSAGWMRHPVSPDLIYDMALIAERPEQSRRSGGAF